MTTLTLAYLGTALCILGSLVGARSQNKLTFGCLFTLFALSSYYLLNDVSFTVSAQSLDQMGPVSMSIQYDLQEKGVQTYDLPFEIKHSSFLFFWGLWGLALVGMGGAWIKNYWVSGATCVAWMAGLGMKLSSIPYLNQISQGETGARAFLEMTSLNVQNILAFAPPEGRWQYTNSFLALFWLGLGCALLGLIMPFLQKWSTSLKNQGLDQSMGRVLLYVGGLCALFACFDGFSSGIHWNTQQASLWGSTMLLSVAAFTSHTGSQSMILSLGAGVLLVL